MPRFLIEVPHGPSSAECDAAIRIFHETGSHFLSHADWGCLDGVHKAWMTVEMPSREEARNILPPAYRHKATVVGLNQFTIDEANTIMAYHSVVREPDLVIRASEAAKTV